MVDLGPGRTSGVSFCANHLGLAAFHAVLLVPVRKFLFSNQMKSTLSIFFLSMPLIRYYCYKYYYA